MKIEHEKSRLTLHEAAAVLGVSKETLRRWERRGLYRAKRDWRGARIYSASDSVALQRLAGLGGGGGGDERDAAK